MGTQYRLLLKSLKEGIHCDEHHTIFPDLNISVILGTMA